MNDEITIPLVKRRAGRKRGVRNMSEPELPSGSRLVTQFINKTDQFKSQYGRLTGIAWLNKEAMRLNRAGIATEIVPDGNEAALIRKDRQ